MRVQITGFANFSQKKKDDPNITLTGVYLYGLTPVDPKYGQGLKTTTLTVWDNQTQRLLPDGAPALLNKKFDIYFDKYSNLEVLQAVPDKA